MTKNSSKLNAVQHHSMFSDFDISLFREGKHYMLYKHLGAHPAKVSGIDGIQFSVWAPNARAVAVIGDFNDWDKQSLPMKPRWDGSGIWELFVPDIKVNALYKYHIANDNGFAVDKADPFAFEAELPPQTASRITQKNSFTWSDKRWLNSRNKTNIKSVPLSIYEVHIGSWRRVPEEGNRYLTFREMADWLPSYCAEMGFTHVELMPVMEHPFYGSWGYQITGYFAPSSRYGTPDDFRYLINELHKLNIGVILDWVPSHFPGDTHGLFQFDGTHLYEHADPREGFHQDWQSYIFNYGRNEVKSFLISNALFWLNEFHIDGLRVDAVASMLYRDYSRKDGEWIPNIYGGRENLEAIAFLQEFNEAVHKYAPGTFTIAEESTAFPGVTHSVSEGGLGFDLKWMMGWMNDTLRYFQRDMPYRSFHQYDLTFSIHYAFTEAFVLPLSHDEVIHGKHSLINKMPGDDWQQAAGLRLLYAYMFGHPGAKLLFMGAEFGQQHEWQHELSMDWHLLQQPFHSGLQNLVKRLNHIYQEQKSLYELAYSTEGFAWIDNTDSHNSVYSWLRKSSVEGDYLLFIMNAQALSIDDYRIGVPEKIELTELLNTDNAKYGGSGAATQAIIQPEEMESHQQPYSISLRLPALSLLILQPQRAKTKKTKSTKQPIHNETQ